MDKLIHRENPTPKGNQLENIPGELLSHILTLLFRSYEAAASPEKYYLPSTLSRVSRKFYDTVQSTPVLWSYIYMASSSVNFKHLEDRINHRSGILPLETYLNFISNNNVNQDRALNMLEGCSARWRSLSIQVHDAQLSWDDPRGVWNQLKRLLKSPAPQLRSLALEYLDFDSDRDSPPPNLRLGPISSPLRSLYLGLCGYDWSANKSFPATLEELHIREEYWHRVDPHYLADSFRGPISHSLYHLILDGFALERTQLNSDSFIFPEPCILENLDFFELRGMDVVEVVVLATLLKTPNIRHLAINIENTVSKGHQFTQNYRILWEGLQFPGFEELNVGSVDEEVGGLAGFLLRLPETVKRFNIFHAGWRLNDMIEGLPSPATQRFRNHVEHLGIMGLSPDRVLHLVPQFPSLKSLAVDIRDLKLHHRGDMYEERRSQVKQLKELPLKVHAITIFNPNLSVLRPTT